MFANFVSTSRRHNVPPRIGAGLAEAKFVKTNIVQTDVEFDLQSDAIRSNGDSEISIVDVRAIVCVIARAGEKMAVAVARAHLISTDDLK